MRRIPADVVAASVAELLVALALTLSPPAHAACKVDSVEMPVRMIGSRAVATIGINGTPVPMTVDSGAFYSMLTDAAAAQLKLTTKPNPNLHVVGLTGSADVRTTTVDKVQLIKGDIGRTEFIVGGNEPGAGTMGLLGRNILSFTDVEYDLAHGVIRFLFPSDDCATSNMAYWAGSTPVTEVELESEYRTKVPAIRAEVKLNGSKLIALFDSGATTLVKARPARNAGVAESDWKPDGTMYGVGRGTASLWTATFDKFEIGGETIRNNRLRIADLNLDDADMILGIDFFLSHRMYISKQQSRLFITYNGGPVFSLDKSAMASADARPAGSPAVGTAVNPGGDGAPLATADELARRGAASAARRDYASALADLDRACELEPTSAALFAQRGTIQVALKHPKLALADFDKALELDPTLSDAHFQRAVLRVNTKDRDGAQADLDAVDRIVAAQAPLRLSMAKLYLALEQPAAAMAQVNQWLAAHPHDMARGDALNSRCWARVTQGIELDQALDDCDDAVDSDGKNASYLDHRGWVYFRLGKYQKALADFDRSIAVQAVNGWALYGRGLTKTRLGDTAQGAADLAAARKAMADIDARVARTGVVVETPAPH